MSRKKILFVGEAATLAHIARPLVLAATLDREQFDVSFACDPRYQWLLRDFEGPYLPLSSVGAQHFLAALARGAPVYDEKLLSRYVEDDLRLLGEAAPDVVVGDFRLSLSISARLRQVPYIAITNCYWSPYWQPQRYPVPTLPLTRYLPMPLAQALFQLARPFAFAVHSRPLNRVRRRHGLRDLGLDLRRVYTDADYVVYADVAELYPEAALPPEHHFIGPLLWSPPVALPEWWDAVPADRPIVYVTLGSSGQQELVSEILRAFEDVEVSVLTASAGARLARTLPPNVFVSEYLPGQQVAASAQLVICNGGSPTTQQALFAGNPLIGIPSNLDQLLNMAVLTRAGAAETIRADRFSCAGLKSAATRLLTDARYREASRAVMAAMRRYDEPRFPRILSGIA